MDELDEKLSGRDWYDRFIKELPEPVDIESKYEFDNETDFDTTLVEEVKVLVEMSEDNGWNNALSKAKKAAKKAAGLD